LEGQEDAVMLTDKALVIAAQLNLDLVKIAPNANPPVCRIVDYGKYCFEQSKREREAKKKQKVVEIKEIRLSMGIDTGDLLTKAKNANKFLKAGNKVKVVVRFRGREMAHMKMGEVLLKRFAGECLEFGSQEGGFKTEGRSMLMFLVAKR
jgi:translation initiation factor IF-3